MPEIDPVIHQPVRLRIMASLMALTSGAEIEFATLRDLLNLTDGNLGAHLATLEESGYIEIRKYFLHRKPRTSLRVTDTGRARFHDHVAALRKIIDAGR